MENDVLVEAPELIIFRIYDKITGEFQGVYSRAYHTEFDFDSAERARHANCHGIHQNKDKYAVAKYKVTYELIEEDCP